MKVVFMGTPQAAVLALERLLKDKHEVVAVWTQPDRPSGRGRRRTGSPVKEFSLEKGLEVHQPVKIRTGKSIGLFKSHKADVAVVVAYGRILSKSYLSAFPNGCINVHFSLLPKYRGAAPVNWAIVNGETKTGVTTMRMDTGLDTGDVLLKRETEIGKEETAIELMGRLSLEGAELLSETLSRLGRIKPTMQDHALASFAPIMSKEDGLIDWSLDAQEIVNRVRGFQPFPRSYTSYKGQKLTLWKASPVKREIKGDNVGEIIEAKANEFLVICGKKTVLRIEELQMQNKRRMLTRDFLNGISIEAGGILGGDDGFI